MRQNGETPVCFVALCGGGCRDRTGDPLLAKQVLIPTELIPPNQVAVSQIRTRRRWGTT